MRLSYSQVVHILRALHHISDDSEGTFRARLRHFQRLGLPVGSKTGRGRAADYDLSMLLQLAVAVEFMQAGVSPLRTVVLVTSNWPETMVHFCIAAAPEGSLKKADGTPVNHNLALCTSPESLRDLTNDGEEGVDYREAFYFQPVEDLQRIFEDDEFVPNLGSFYRWIVILLKPLVHLVMFRLEKDFNISPIEALDSLYSATGLEPFSQGESGDSNGNP